MPVVLFCLEKRQDYFRFRFVICVISLTMMLSRVILIVFVISFIVLETTDCCKDKDKKKMTKKEVYVMKKCGCGCNEKITLSKVGYVKEKKKKKKGDDDDEDWFHDDDDRRRRKRSLQFSSLFSSSNIISVDRVK
jgi:hypothetical protein